MGHVDAQLLIVSASMSHLRNPLDHVSSKRPRKQGLLVRHAELWLGHVCRGVVAPVVVVVVVGGVLSRGVMCVFFGLVHGTHGLDIS
jgi:hypothetical protein